MENITLEYTLNKETYSEFLIYMARPKIIALRLLISGIIFIISLYFSSIMLKDNMKALIIGELFISILLLSISFFKKIEASGLDMIDFSLVNKVTFLDKIYLNISETSHFIEFSKITEILHLNHSICLIFNKNHAVILPKYALNSINQDEFFTFLKKHCPNLKGK